jgi:cytochrome c oxidase subunit 2
MLILTPIKAGLVFFFFMHLKYEKPVLKGLYGKKQVVFDPNGVEREVMVDDAYLVRAIQNPGAEEVKGYPAVMPETPMSNADLQEIVDFIKTLKD